MNHLFDSAPKSRMIALVLALGEVLSVLVRHKNAGRIPDHVYQQALVEFRSEIIDDPNFVLHSVSDDLVRTSLPLIEQYSLNATDALVLRSALDVAQSLRAAGDDLAMISSDIRLITSAQASGLAVWNPEVNDQAALDALI
jgi:predicted nucleic acid-binding protein